MNGTKEISAIIKTLREEKKISQNELAKIVFRDEKRNNSISRMELGNQENIYFENVYKTLKALDIDLIELIKTKM